MSIVANLSIDPEFHTRRGQLEFAAKCTCYAFLPSVTGRMCTGTAFFVGPRTLITVGHLAPKVGTVVKAQLPGTREVEAQSENLWFNTSSSSSPSTIKCV